MSYLGSPPASQFFAPGTDTFSGDGTTVAFTLSRNVGTVNDILVVVNNVDQQPSNYTVLNNVLTFSPAPSSGTNNIYVRYLSTNLTAIVPQAGSIVPGNFGIDGNLNFSGSARRITGDFSNATVANRVAFQTSTVNGSTTINAIPNGTSFTAGYNAFNAADPTNSGQLNAFINGSEVSFRAAIQGTGTYLPMTFYTGGSERMRIDSSGNLLVGTTVQRSAAKFGVDFNPALNSGIVFYPTSNVGYDAVRFLNNSTTQIGVITCSTTNTTYTTSSDYRLKEDVQPMVGALAKVSALKPVTYKWKSDGSNGEGFIAHELQAVVPDCVTGEKDAVNEDGSIKPQGIDTSFLVATLTAAIQEQQAMIEELKTKVAALEAR